MAAKLGASFLRSALSAVNYAGSLLAASRVAEGLSELAPDALAGAMQRGIAEAARRVGVPPQDIQRILPMRDLDVVLHRLGVSQPQAVEAWKMHAGHLGGLLAGVADLTVDGRAPDASLCLERVAKKVVRDTRLAEPLGALAIDVGAWQGLLDRCRVILDDGGALARAYQKRKMRMVVIGGLASLTVLAMGLAFAVAWTWRSRVTSVLDAGDPCAAAALSERDVGRVSASLQAEVEAARKKCDEQKAEETRKREAEQREREREAKCKTLAAHVEGRAMDEADAKFAGEGAAFLKRISDRELVAADLGSKPPPTPCDDDESKRAVSAGFEEAVVASTRAWLNAEKLSNEVTAILAKHAGEVDPEAKRGLHDRAEADASRAIVSGEAGLVARAVRLCKLQETLGIAHQTACSGLLAVEKRK